METCPDGTYEDKVLKKCIKCSEPCYTCTSDKDCLSCDRTNSTNALINYFDTKHSCYETCPAISVPTPSKQCLPCTDNCETC